MKQLWIGLSGKAGSGKDEAARGLIERLNFDQLALAYPVKLFCMTYDNSNKELREQSNNLIATTLFQDLEVAPLIDNLMQQAQPGIWRKLTHREAYVKKTDWSRRVLYTVGDGMRNLVPGRDDVWIDYLFRQVEHCSGRYVITDIRYPNEIQRLLTKPNSIVCRIRRDISTIAHCSETSLDHYQFDSDKIIDNCGTIDELHCAICKIARKLIKNRSD